MMALAMNVSFARLHTHGLGWFIVWFGASNFTNLETVFLPKPPYHVDFLRFLGRIISDTKPAKTMDTVESSNNRA